MAKLIRCKDKDIEFQGEGGSKIADEYEGAVRYCRVCNRYHFFDEWKEVPPVPHFFGEQAKFTGMICDDCRWRAEAEGKVIGFQDEGWGTIADEHEGAVGHCPGCNRFNVFGEWTEIPSVPHFFGEQAKFKATICDDCRWRA
jgi:C4-type Zn-finger protein